MATIQQLEDAIVRARAAGDEESSQYLLDQRNQKLEEKYGPTVKSRRGGKAGFFENVGTGLASGAVGMYESAALGGAALLEEEEELKARDKIQSVASSFRPDGGDKESLTYKLASGIGSIGALLPTALLGPAALPAAAAIAGGAGAGEASERARDFGATEEERSSAAFRGTAIGLLELAPLGRIAKGLQIPGVAKVLEKVEVNDLKGIKDGIRSVATTGVAEGAQEAAAAILQNLNARGYDPEAELIDAGVLDEATIGGGAGAIIQALADVIVRGKARTAKGGEAPDITDEEAVEIAGLLPAPSDDVVVSPTGEAGTAAQQDEARRTRDDAQREQEAEDETALGDMPSAGVRRPTEQRDLFAEDLEKAERDAALAPEGMSDVEMADAMAEQDAESERAKRLEDDDQIKEQPDMVDEAGYDAFQAKQIAERTATEDIELEQMQRDEDAAKDAETLEVERMIVADEDKAALRGMEAQIPERRSAVETGDVDSAAKTNIPERRVVAQEEQVDQTGPTESEKVAIASNLTALINKNKKEPSTEIMAGRLEKSIAKDKRRGAALTGEVSDTSSQEAAPAVRTLNPKTNKFKFKNSEQFINRHPALEQDRGKLVTLMGATLPRQTRTDIEFTDAAKEGQTQARTVKRYLEQFDDVDSALINAVSEASDPESKNYRTYDESTEKKPSGTLPIGKDPLAKNLAGTGGNNAKAVLAWAKDNLSAETNTQLDSRFKAAKERAKVAKDSRNARGTKAAEDKLKSDREARGEAARLKRNEEAEADINNEADFKAKVKDAETGDASKKADAVDKSDDKKIARVVDTKIAQALGSSRKADVKAKPKSKPITKAKRAKLIAATAKGLLSNQEGGVPPSSIKTSKQQQREELAVQ